MTEQLKDVRLTFPQLWEPKQVNGQGDPKFSGAFLFKPDHSARTQLLNAVVAAAKAKWGEALVDVKEPDPADATKIITVKRPNYEVVLKQLKATDRICVHDGDSKSEYDGYAGHLFVNASNKIKPLVIGPNRENLVPADGKPYSGCYVNAIVEIWAQDNQFGKRINASLMGVQFVRDGERLAGGAVAAADDFEAIPDAAAPAGAAPAAKAGAASLF